MAARRDGDGDEVREARDALLELGRGPVRGVVVDEPDRINELVSFGSISRPPEVVGRIFMTDGEGGDLERLAVALNHPKAKPNCRSMIDYSSALHVAAENHELEAIKALLDDGRCNANARNYYIRTPCHVAATVGDFEIVELLAKHSQALADLTLKDYESKTCWELARIHGFHDCADNIEHLASNGAGMRLRRCAFSRLSPHPLQVPGEIDYEYVQPPIYGTDLDMEIDCAFETVGENAPGDSLEKPQSFKPDEKTELQSRQLSRELCCRASA
ncbi:hypothetical protein AURANDRAFT_66396 [Aureococcus anophagefferens]|uniref:Uncharacterized protein n=1 Tax=Aureococcus anophagefferens TaxID=44056 RepID=F0YHD9_AURAN|nr:hypothetical protein AURANDRAFT_66396 [Aureococcus anophagefferens]EGB05493.1 hypothetical protein AURANDRAFT_66396 [Aureococcus anophagefferens]|eukprot:XP_009039875.1 hypothetical protein AURANDRAFT_66396 [Aureococcus anophagefferens]